MTKSRTSRGLSRLSRRQRVLLALLRACGGQMAERDFQQLLFTYGRRCRKRGATAPYDFIAHERSPRSFTAVADRDRLARRGLMDPEAWHLTDEGHRLAANIKDRDVAVFAARIRSRGTGSGSGANGRALIAGRDRSAVAKPGSKPTGGLLATIGYEGRSYEEYLNELLKSGISRLCDVRSRPLSRKWGFSKGLLSQGCRELGITYESFPELGIESRHRNGVSDRAAYDRLFALYEETTLFRCRDAVARITGWIERGERVALTCFERDSRDCHRSRLARAIVKAAAEPLWPRHL